MTDQPEPVARLEEVMSGFRRWWSLCGGWAVDAWLGRQTREHHDIEVSVFEDDQRALFDYLAGWRLVAHDAVVGGDTSDQWDGRTLVLPAHVHGRSPADFDLEIILNERSQEGWVLRHEPLSLDGNWSSRRKAYAARPLSSSARQSAWGVNTAAPEILLFYKATAYAGVEGYPRPHDESDFFALVPILAAEAFEWLRQAIVVVEPGHPWLDRLPSAP